MKKDVLHVAVYDIAEHNRLVPNQDLKIPVEHFIFDFTALVLQNKFTLLKNK
jgi:hypothetical protein